MALFGLVRRKPYERQGFELYGAAVAAARAPAHFAGLGVPDTLTGRFDLVGLFVALLLHRLRAERSTAAQALSQAVFDAMFADMDVNLRELGVGDLSVGKRVRRLWEAFHGRAEAYMAALDSGDEAVLAAALARNVWAGEIGPDSPGPRGLAALARAQAAALARQPLGALASGRVDFLAEAEPVCGGQQR